MKHPATFFLPFLEWGRTINKRSLQQDMIAGLTGAVLALPQGVAYAFIAGLPPEFGLYSAIVVCILAALFGSSRHMVSGPTAALSIVILSVVNASLDTPLDYISAVLTLTFLVGIIQLGLGLLRLGSLVNFISHTVIVGFTAGAAILIACSQLKHLLGVEIPGGLSFISQLDALANAASATDPLSLAIGLSTLATAALVRKLNRALPHLLIGLTTGATVFWLLDGKTQGVELIGSLNGSLPPLTLPSLEPAMVQQLIPGAFAIALLGLIEAVSIARAIALRSHQQIDSNQEFIGQGLSNLGGSFFSCFAGSGSFTRSGANYDSGAQTPLAAILSSLFLLSILLFFPALTAYLPLPAMAGAILLIAWNLIDWHHIGTLLRSSRNEALILSATFLSTLLIQLEFAIYVGVILSLCLYLRRTSRPSVIQVAPRREHPERWLKNVHRYQLEQCPQLKLLRLDGSLFFGAVAYIQHQIRQQSLLPGSRLLIIGKGINFIDFAGYEMLVQEARRIEADGGSLMICSLKGTVLDEMQRYGDFTHTHAGRIFDTPKAALEQLIPTLNSDKCAQCDKRIFNECRLERDQSLPADHTIHSAAIAE